MNRLSFVAIVFIALGLATLSAQQQGGAIATPAVTPIATLPEPEWPGMVYQLVDNKLELLTKEKLVPLVQSKTYALGMGGSAASVGYEVKGVSCPTRIPATAVLVVRVTGPIEDADPSRILNIDRLTVDTKSGSRKIVMSKGKLNPWSGKSKNETPDTAVEINATHYGTNSLRFTTTSPILPGEYLATTKSGAFCFGMEQ
jgi:hypothetical protein